MLASANTEVKGLAIECDTPSFLARSADVELSAEQLNGREGFSISPCGMLGRVGLDEYAERSIYGVVMDRFLRKMSS
jgi:hypothetical protein